MVARRIYVFHILLFLTALSPDGQFSVAAAANTGNAPSPAAVSDERKNSPSAKPGASDSLVIDFAKKPNWWHHRRQAEAGMASGLCIRGSFRVTDRDARPVSGRTVTMYARTADTGVFRTGQATTDTKGEAVIDTCFDMPPGSLRFTVQGCIEGEAGSCTDVLPLTTRKPIEFQLGFDFGATIVPNPVRQDNQSTIPIYADNTFSLALWPKVQVNVFEAEHKWKYYRLSIYGTVPYLYQNRSLVMAGELTQLSYYSVASEANIGDFATGINLVLGPKLSADIAYNGRSGKISPVDAIRTQGQPRPIVYGDGFESIDGTLMVNQPLGSRRPILFGVGSGSHALPRRFPEGDSAKRGDFYQLVAGFAFPRKSGASAFMVWGGYADYRETRLILDSKPTIATPARQDWIMGITFSSMGRRRANFTTGAFAGGLGSGQTYFGLNLRVDLNLF